LTRKDVPARSIDLAGVSMSSPTRVIGMAVAMVTRWPHHVMATIEAALNAINELGR
jgi:hypothetical protein